MAEYERALAPALPATSARRRPACAAENIQARIRGNLMMALSNKHGWLVLTTGNKSEMSVGYATLYGDMAGGFAAIKDVPKTLVYELVAPPQRGGRPRADPRLGDRAPALGRAAARPARQRLAAPYDLLDRVLEAYVERDQGREEMIAAGHARRGRRRGGAHGRSLRVQAPPGGAGDPDHAARLRPRPAAADHEPLRRLGSDADGVLVVAIGLHARSVILRRWRAERGPRSRGPRPPRPRWCGRGGGRGRGPRS